MEQKHLYTSDEKLKWWGYGEWVEESDEATFEHQGFECNIHRKWALEGPNGQHVFGGYFCGYVVIPKNQFAFHFISEIQINVHGGITFRELEADDNYLIGFDCAHSFDLIPSMENRFCMDEDLIELRKQFPNSKIWNKTYKNIEYCIEQCKSICDQLKDSSICSQ